LGKGAIEVKHLTKKAMYDYAMFVEGKTQVP